MKSLKSRASDSLYKDTKIQNHWVFSILKARKNLLFNLTFRKFFETKVG